MARRVQPGCRVGVLMDARQAYEKLRLFHYTCDDGLRAILKDNSTLRPGSDGFLWLTDLEFPVRDALGLTSHSLNCDRTSHRFEVVLPGWDKTPPWPVVPWMELRRMVAFAPLAAMLEAAPGAMPRHWWVASRPLPSILSEVGR